MTGGLTSGSAAEEASMGEILMIPTGSSSDDAGDGMGEATVFGGGGSNGSSGEVPGM